MDLNFLTVTSSVNEIIQLCVMCLPMKSMDHSYLEEYVHKSPEIHIRNISRSLWELVSISL